MQSDAYWKNRAEQRMYNYQLQADAAADDIAQSYIKSTDYINNQIRKIFSSGISQTGISEAEAEKIIKSTETDKAISMRQLVKKYAKKILDPDKRQEFLSFMDTPQNSFRIRRLEELQADIDKQTRSLTQTEETLGTEHYTSLAGESYNRTIFDIQKGIGVRFSFSAMPASMIVEILRNNWSGKHFSERIWGNMAELNTKIKRELMVGFMTGRPYKKTADALQRQMATGAMEARRLVRTESTYISNMAELDAYKECRIKKYKFVATLDAHTSDICQSLDNKIFDVDKGVPGTNMPAMHPWCRSTTIGVIDGAVQMALERRARNPKTGGN